MVQRDTFTRHMFGYCAVCFCILFKFKLQSSRQLKFTIIRCLFYPRLVCRSIMTSPVKKRKVDYTQIIKRGFLTEHNVGVTEFIGKQKPFIGILKHRFEDFVVHEINPKGEIVRLECNGQPEDIALEEEEKVPIINNSELKVDSAVLESIRVFSENPANSEPVFVPTDELAKEDRTKVHVFIRQNYPQLESKTESINGKSFIKIVATDESSFPRRRGNEKRKGDNRSQKRLRWPKSKPNYLHFVMYKENMETVQAVNELARKLACTTKNFTFAGTKDKRAITSQMFAAWKTNPYHIWKAVQEFNRRSRGQIKLHVGHFTFSPEPLKLGDLSGNHFEIVLRNIRPIDDGTVDGESQKTSDEELKGNVEQSLESVKKNGFINYFGMQRFGSHKVNSHKLGILILKRDFKQLVNEILVEKPTDLRPYNNRDEVSFNDAIRIWRETGDAALAYKKMNYKYTIEGSLLRALSRVSANDYHGALCIGLLRNSRLLYLHAYQSYLWNRVASYRIREFGLEVVEGDLVFVGPDFVDEDMVEDEVAIDGAEEEAGGDNEKESPTMPAPANIRIKSNINSEHIILVTADNRSHFTIYDVVLPIVGGMSRFPKNSTKVYIDKILEEDGVQLEDFSSLSKQWCVNGSYRKLVVKPTDFHWEWKRYTDDTAPLIQTDLDRLNSKTKKTEEKAEEKEENETGAEQQTGLSISVALPTSSYATVLLREVTKLSSLALENKPWQQGPSAVSNADDDEKQAASGGKVVADEEQLRERTISQT